MEQPEQSHSLPTNHAGIDLLQTELCTSQIATPNLPYEILESILRYLHPNVQDLASCSCVCRSWGAVAGRLLGDTAVIRAAQHLDDTADLLLNSDRTYKHWLIEGSDLRLSGSFGKAWCDVLGPEVESLTVDACFVKEADFTDLLAACPKLRALNLRNLEQTLLSGSLLTKEADRERVRAALVNVSHFELICSRHVNDQLLFHLSQILPSLTSLSLATINISYQDSIQNRFYPPLRKLGPCEFVATFGVVLHWISNMTATLRHLDLSGTRIDTHAVEKLIWLSDLKLNSLSIAASEQVNSSTIELLCSAPAPDRFPGSLRRLDLSDCHRVTGAALERVAEGLPDLEWLSVRGCWAVTADSLSGVVQRHKMRHLEAGGCDTSSACAVRQPLQRRQPWLRHLGVASIGVDARHLSLVAAGAPYLTSLDLTACTHTVRNTMLQLLSGLLQHLQTLLLVKCCFLTDAGFMGECYHDPRLSHSVQHCQICLASLVTRRAMSGANLTTSHRRVELCSCRVTCTEHDTCLAFNTYDVWHRLMDSLTKRRDEECNVAAETADDEPAAAQPQLPAAAPIIEGADGRGIEEPELEEFFPNLGTRQPASFLNMTGLRKLNLCGCLKLTDHVLMTAFRFKELVWLNLSQCPHVSNLGLSVMASHCPSLQELSLGRCEAVDDMAVLALTHHLLRLQRLHLQHCPLLSSDSLDSIASCLSLRYLDITHCRNLPSSAVESLMVLAPRLKVETGNTVYRGAEGPDGSSTAPPPPPPMPFLAKMKRRIFPNRMLLLQ